MHGLSWQRAWTWGRGGGWGLRGLYRDPPGTGRWQWQWGGAGGGGGAVPLVWYPPAGSLSPPEECPPVGEGVASRGSYHCRQARAAIRQKTLWHQICTKNGRVEFCMGFLVCFLKKYIVWWKKITLYLIRSFTFFTYTCCKDFLIQIKVTMLTNEDQKLP